MLSNRIITRLLISSAVLAIAAPALAQPDQQQAARADSAAGQGKPTAAESSADIVVTATRRAVSLQDTPVAVDVVSGADVAKLNLFDVKEIQNIVPGLSLTNSDGRSNVATLRGISFNPDSAAGPAVEVYFNEVSVNPNTFFAAIYDIGQIEVLRGPQGLFRGKVSPAGAIVIGSARPDLEKPTGYFQGTGSDRNAYNFQGAASLPLVPGTLGLRVAALVDSNRAGNVRNIDGRHSKVDTLSGRVSLRWEPSPDFRADLTYQYLNRDATVFRAVFGPGSQPSPNSFFPLRSGPPLEIGDRTSVTEGSSRFLINTHVVTLNLGYDLGGAELAFNGGYQNSRVSSDRDQDAANAVPGYQLPQTVTSPFSEWKSELLLRSTGTGRLNWMVSGNYENARSVSTVVAQRNDVFLSDPFGGIFPGMTGPGPVPPQIFNVAVPVDVTLPITTQLYAVAGLVSYELSDGLTISGGLRQTWRRSRRTQTTVVPAFGLNTVVESLAKPKALTGGATATWEINPDLTIYGSYGRSFRPGVFAVGVSSPLDPSILQTPDETSDGFEAGIKTNLFDRRVSLNIAAFYQKFKNYIDQVNGITTNSSQIPGRVDESAAPLPTFGNAISKGVEVQLTARPNDFIDLGVNAAYADAHYDNARVYCNDFNGDGVPDSIGTPSVPGTQQVALCARNDRLSEVPKFSLSANGEVRFARDGVIPFVRSLVSYRPGYYSQNTNFTYRDFTKVDLFVGVRLDGRWEATLFAKNLLDQARATLVSQGNGQQSTTSAVPGFAAIPFDSGYRLADITPPREFGLTLRFNW